MRISRVTIKNFRSIEHVSLELDSYGTFIGANGTGKSSVLYALDWFFNGTPLSDVDVHGCNEVGAVEPGATIEVSVTFKDLNAKDKERLQQYGRGTTAQIRRTWYADTKQTKTVGNAKQGPGFADVRSDQAIATRRQGYRTLRETHTDLEDLPGNASKDAMLDALSAWESDESHQKFLVDVPDADASQMMGWHGTNVLRECVRFVLIPAATSIAGEVGSASRGTALTELVGAFMAAASARAQAAWLTKHASAVDELASDIRRSIEGATGVQAKRINSRLSTLIPNASVELAPSVPEFVPKLDPTISTAVTIAGVTNDVSRQGHGVQRAVMISMFQAMVPDEDLMRQTHEPQIDENDEAAANRLEDALANLPSIIVAVEEPEIYQHPVRARAFARTLLELSEQPHVQVLLATHSPFFVQPAQFSALHRFTYNDGKTLVYNTTTQDVAAASGLAVEKIEGAILKYVPTEFSEGFFADAVVLVEGQTDRIVVEAVATMLGNDLDRLGITVLSVEGKGGLQTTLAILTNLGIPTYTMADGDFGTANRKVGKSDADKANAHATHKRQTEDLIRVLPTSAIASHGSLPASFGGASVVSNKFAVWADDLEEELRSWDSFERALAASGIDLAARNNKNQLAYRNAVFEASKEDLPESLASLVTQIVKLSCHANTTDDSISASTTSEGTL